MAVNEQAEKYRSLDDWFQTPQGHRVSIAMASELEVVQTHLKGDIFVQLGSCGENPWLPSFSFTKKWLINPCKNSLKSSLVSSLNGFPFDRNSIDCIFAPLTLEAFFHDKPPIDEMDRILKPMGYVIFMGINPLSFWGYSLRWGNLACFGNRTGALTSSFSLKRAMLSRGYHQCLHSSFLYIPPISNKNLIEKFEILNEAGKMVRPFPAGFYCIVMQKYQHDQTFTLMETVEEEVLMACKPSWPAAGNMRR